MSQYYYLKRPSMATSKGGPTWQLISEDAYNDPGQAARAAIDSVIGADSSRRLCETNLACDLTSAFGGWLRSSNHQLGVEALCRHFP